MQLAGNQVNIADGAHRTARRLHQPYQEVIDDRHQAGQFLLGALEVLNREHVQAHLRNRQLGAPGQKINNPLRTGRMPLTGAQAALSRPAAVAVHQHSNVGGQDFRAQRALQGPLVDGQLRDSTGVAGMTVHGNHGQGVSAHGSYLIRLSKRMHHGLYGVRAQALILRPGRAPRGSPRVRKG